MEVSALKYSGGLGLHGRSALLRLQSDERLVAFVRRGNPGAFELLVKRYESRLHSFCRHLLGSREDAEDVMQEVLAAAFNAMVADERPINVRPWLYRIARNRSLNHLRRIQAVGVDSMDVHFSDNGASTADKVHDREEFRLLVGDIHELPETQKTALVLREMDAMSYEQIAEAMETTVASVKSLLVRARVSLAEASEARLLSCDEVRIELGEIAEGLRRKPTPLVRRHLRQCHRCSAFQVQLRKTNKALAALLPLGPIAILKKVVLTHVGHGAGSGATAGSSAGAGAGATAAGTGVLAGSGAGGFVSAGLGAIATKAAAGLAAAALVTAGAVEVDHATTHSHHTARAVAAVPVAPARRPSIAIYPTAPTAVHQPALKAKTKTKVSQTHGAKPILVASVTPPKPDPRTVTTPTVTTPTPTTPTPTTPTPTPPPGRTQSQSDPTVLSGTSTTASPTPTTPPTSTGPTGVSQGTPPPTATAPVPTTPAPTTTTSAGTPPPSTTTIGTPPPTTFPAPTTPSGSGG